MIMPDLLKRHPSPRFGGGGLGPLEPPFPPPRQLRFDARDNQQWKGGVKDYSTSPAVHYSVRRRELSLHARLGGGGVTRCWPLAPAAAPLDIISSSS